MYKSARFLIIVLCFGFVLLLTNFIDKKYSNPLKNVSENYEIKALKIPKNLNLAGESVPTEKPDVRQRIDRELLVNTYWQSNGLLLIKRAHKYFPIIVPLLKKYDVPDDFKYLALAESGLQNIVSPSGATGFWQFLKSTGKRYNLEINKNVDERYDIEKATKAATDYLKYLKSKLGSWTLASAAYNAGYTKIATRLQEQQVTNYYDLLLNSETYRYVFRVVALKEIITHPKKYGFLLDEEDLYTFPEIYTVKVDTAISNMTAFAKKFDITYKELKLLNPWLREKKLDNKTGKIYKIKIPTKR